MDIKKALFSLPFFLGVYLIFYITYVYYGFLSTINNFVSISYTYLMYRVMVLELGYLALCSLLGL